MARSVEAFWNRHVLLPLGSLVAACCVLEVFRLDPVLARLLYFDTQTSHWLGTGPGEWWARDLLHGGGRWLVRAVAASAIAAWILSLVVERVRAWRLPAGYVALAMLLSTAVVGGLKAITNVDCPWDLAGFGGHHPYIALFADRPDALPRAQCFPGAHASSGYALMCFYFVWRDGWPRLAAWALAFGILVGLAFSIGQEARGAHFASHDLVSLGVVWIVQLALYWRLLGPRKRPPADKRMVRTSG
jgi:membrane-associated PAP2 superfamily phosphatase